MTQAITERLTVLSQGLSKGLSRLPEWAKQGLWFVGLWAGGVATVSAIGLLIRWVLIG